MDAELIGWYSCFRRWLLYIQLIVKYYNVWSLLLNKPFVARYWTFFPYIAVFVVCFFFTCKPSFAFSLAIIFCWDCFVAIPQTAAASSWQWWERKDKQYSPACQEESLSSPGGMAGRLQRGGVLQTKFLSLPERMREETHNTPTFSAATSQGRNNNTPQSVLLVHSF